MARETGKQRSQRIQIDYFRRRTGLDRLKSFCIAAGLLGGGLYAAYVLAAGSGSQTSTGPLATVHASFEEDCQQCHKDFTPINPQAARLDWKPVGLNSAESIAHIETACQKCHHVGDHYRGNMNAQWQLEDQNCATCHADHQGRDHDLTLVTSQQCTSCHSDLSIGCKATPSVRSAVTAFDKQQHGDFGSLAKGDPGKIKFDHHQHMRPGQVNEGEKGAITIGMLDPVDRDRYRRAGQDDSSMVTLDCSSCHEMAGNPDRAKSLIADGELGRYIKPISFDQHCAACHSMNPSVATPDSAPLPHAAPWAQIDLLLAGTISGARATGQSRTPRDDSQPNPQPGQGLGTAPETYKPASAADVTAARQLVEAQCLKCHDPGSITDDAITASLRGVADPMIPPRWLVHGLYDHGAHRQVDCRYCHAEAYGPESSVAQPPGDHQVVMIDGIDTCTPCHRDPAAPEPQSLTNDAALLGGQPTWASDQCTLCHRYHTPHGDGVEVTP